MALSTSILSRVTPQRNFKHKKFETKHLWSLCTFNFKACYFQICKAIDEYLRINAKALYTVYTISKEFDDASEQEVEIGVEAGQSLRGEPGETEGFANTYEELVPRRRSFLARIFSAARTG